MLCRSLPLVAALVCAGMSMLGPARAAALDEGEPIVPGAVVCDKNASFAERLAAKEIRRYVYLRTGNLLPIVEDLGSAADGGLIVAGRKDRPAVKALLTDEKLKATVEGLAPEQYLLRAIKHKGRPVQLVAGGDSIGTLYGAYRLAEHLGVRFYMHGDVVPDGRIALKMPQVDEIGKPLFDRRGILPFHDFPEGPDWWNVDGYKAILGQLPKMRMNFFGLHTYGPSGAGPEPLTWYGAREDVHADGTVRFSYPSHHFTTNLADKGFWGYRPKRTSEYAFGAAAMYDRDNYGADYMRDTRPWNKMSPEQCNRLFNRVGRMLGDVFGFARQLGIKTCIGTETPLRIPPAVKARLKAAGKAPDDPAVVQELYEGMFRRIIKTHPLDYYWLWTPEGWTWEKVSQGKVDATLADFKAVIAAAKKVKAPFTLATCGWVLGPPQDPSLFDNVLPKEMPMSCISRQVGFAPVEPGFANVEGRPQWAIPWMEDDPAMIIPQLWVGRMRKDAADARKYGCTGLLGIHWRTRILGPNVSALAKAAWDQSGWNPEAGKTAAGEKTQSRDLPAGDFYADWARSQFGGEAAGEIAALFTRLDGGQTSHAHAKAKTNLPRPSTWVGGPGGIKPDGRPWAEAGKAYAFVDELARLRPKVKGAGNLERFDYWLDNFRYLRSVGQVNCTWARLNKALDKVKATKDAQAKKKLARELALPIRKELVAQVGDLHRHLLATVTTPGGMGTVTNWQQHVMPMLLGPSERDLSKILGGPLPADAMPDKEYSGPARLFVPAIRTALVAGEPLKLKAVVLGANPSDAAVYWRPLGAKTFAKVPLEHVARGVYTVTLPAKADLEYFIQMKSEGGKTLSFPPTAPALNQTVVVVDEK